LLQFAASRLWTERDRERRLLTRASYQAMGGIAGTLAGHADHVLDAIPARERALVRSIFERLVTPERTRAVVSLGELRELPGDPDDLERLVHRLVDARLLVIEARTGEDRTVELVHESLLERWPTLVGWLDENRDDAAFLSRLRTAAAQWQASDRDEGMLWRDEPARRALAWRSHYRGELGRRERAYLDAVHAVATRGERRRRLLRRRVIAAVVAVPMILLAVAGMALVRITRAEREASKQRDEANARATQLRKSRDELQDRERKISELLDETRQASQQVAAERDKARLASEQVAAERDKARHQQEAAERARDEATAAAHQARLEKANAERAAREAEAAREKEAEAAERARQSEQRRKQLMDRAVGPIETQP
jgi:hypothetical protein